MQKIITNIITFILLFGLSASLRGQECNNSAVEKILFRTHYQSISDQEFIFPSSSKAAEVFAKGKELLIEKEMESLLPEAVSQKINSETSQMIQYLPIIQKTHNSEKINSHRSSVISAWEKEQNNKDLEHYRDLYRQIVWNENGLPDLTKVSTARAYLAFYNLILRDGQFSRLRVGVIDEHFPLLGANAEAFAELQKKFGNNDAYLWFTFVIYNGGRVAYMIPLEDARQADNISKQILYRDFQKYGLSSTDADQWLQFATSWDSTICDNEFVEGSTLGFKYLDLWFLSLFLRPQNQLIFKGDFRGEQTATYLPVAVVACHEFQHVKDTFPGGDVAKTSLSELTAILHQVVMSDDINRQIHPTPANKPVKYMKSYGFSGIDIGDVAIFFRKLSKKYDTDNYAELLLKPEAVSYINKEYIKDAENVGKEGLPQHNNFTPEELRERGKELIHEALYSQFEDL